MECFWGSRFKAGVVLLGLFMGGSIVAALPDSLTVNVGDVTGDGQDDNAILSKRSLRAAGYRVWAYDGANYTHIAAPEVRTYRGHVDSDPSIQLNAWVDQNNQVDINFNDGRHHLQRLTNLSVDLSGPGGTPDPGTGNVIIARTVDRTSPTPSGYIIPRYTMSRMLVGVDVCNDVYVGMGSDISAAVGFCEQRVNDSDYFYARDMSLAWEISEVVVRVGADPDSWKTFWKGSDGITPNKFNTKVRFKAPGGGGSAGRIFSATADFPNSHSATVGSLSPYSRSLGHEVAHGMGVGHYSSWEDTMSGSRSALGTGTVQKMIEELHLASAASAPAIIYGAALAPHAMEDCANTQQNQPVIIDLFENDYDGNGDSLTLAFVDSTSDRGGVITVVSGGTVQYTPPTGYLGVDRFRYHVADTGGLTNRNGLVKVYVRNTDLATHILMDETDGMVAHDVGPYQAHGLLDSSVTPFSAGSQVGVIGNALENLTDSVTRARIRSDMGDPVNDSLSASLWVKFNTPPTADAAIISKGGAVIRGRVDNIRGGWAVSVDDGKFYFACKLQTDSQYEGHLADLRSTSNVQTGQWYHLVMTMDRQNRLLRAWVNNSEVTNTLAGTTIPDGIIENYYPLTLFNCSNDDASLPCVMDDVRIFNKVLTPPEVAELYAANDEIPAGAPSPFNGANEVLAGETLSWMPGKPMPTYEFDVYFGTSQSAVANATRASDEYAGRQSAANFRPATTANTQYYWRIDEVTSSHEIVPGSVWKFYTGGTVAGPAITNPSFEEPVLGAGNSVSYVTDWYDAASYTYTKDEADTNYPETPYGDNWAELGNGRWIYQQIGIYTENTTYDVSFLLGQSQTNTFGSVTVELLAGGNPVLAGDQNVKRSEPSFNLEASVGAVVIDSSGSLNPFSSGGMNDTEEMTVQLSTGTAGTGCGVGDPLWLLFFRPSVSGRALIDNVRIAPPNTPPSFTSNPVEKAPAAEMISYAGDLSEDVHDPGDTLTFVKVTGPAWLTVQPNGLLEGTPGQADIGENVFLVTVTDSHAESDTAEVHINVLDMYLGTEGFSDFAGLAFMWMADCEGYDYCDGADLSNDGKVDLSDLYLFCETWLE